MLLVLAVLLIAIAGLPPFPGFWAKWELVMQLSGAKLYVAIGAILVGSLLEAAYMFGWFKQATRPTCQPSRRSIWISFGCCRPPPAPSLLAGAGLCAASMAGAASWWLFAPLCVGALLFALDWLPGRLKCTVMLAAVLGAATWMIADVEGLRRLFACSCWRVA